MSKVLTDEDGIAWLPISIETAGDLRLTVVKRNHKPYYVDLPCVIADQVVGLNTATLDDDNTGGTSGNNNGVMNPGETIDIALSLRNSGSTTTATGVTVSTVSDNSNVHVVTGSATFADIAPGATVNGNSPLRITVTPTMKQGETAKLAITVTTSSSTSTDYLELTCVAGAVEYVSHSLSGTPFGPGATSNLQVTIRNSGDMSLQDATVEMVSQSPFVSVVGNISYGTIAPGQQVTNTGNPFQITANVLTYRGHQAPMLLIVQTTGGYRDTTAFVVPVGNAASTDPTGPDGYGYYAYDNTDISYEMHPEFSYVNISAGLGTNLDIADIGEKTGITPSWSKAADVPFPFTYYGENFDSITVCSNGWLAFGKQTWNDAFRDYPIPAMIAPSSMVAPYWDDLKTSGGGLGVWKYYDAANHRFIIQWKAAGGGLDFNQANLDFEVILLDTSYYPTYDGNGMILFQYQDVTMNLNAGGGGSDASGCSVGIQDRLSTTGLRYAFRSAYSPGAASIVDGRAIMFTTNGRNLVGCIDGVITDAETSSPMEGVTVNIVGTSYQEVTGADGSYLFDAVIIGSKALRASFPRYNDAMAQDVMVLEDLMTTVNFSMQHPEFRLSSDQLLLTVPPDDRQPMSKLSTTATDLRYYNITVSDPSDVPVDPWDAVENINVTSY